MITVGDDDTVTTKPQVRPKTTVPKHTYSVKIINPNWKTAYSIRKLRVSCDFETTDDIKQQLCDTFTEYIEDSDVDLEIGYINPGHGARGQQ